MSNFVVCNQDIQEAELRATHAGVSLTTMMDNAGIAVAKVIISRFPKAPVLVICGTGNNGGDGLVTALHLREAGWPVDVWCGSNSNQDRIAIDTLPYGQGELTKYAIIVDAIFGIGLSRDVSVELSTLFEHINACSATVVSIDIPSGVHGNNGHIMGAAVMADITVTFQAAKIGHVLLPGRRYTGELVVADIGLKDLPQTLLLNSKPTLPCFNYELNKYSRGHLLIVGGSMPGASLLATAAGQRSGAGIVTLAVASDTEKQYRSVPSSVVLRTHHEIPKLIQERKVSAVVIGPGFGLHARELTLTLLNTGLPCVVDADALTAFADDPQSLFGYSNAILTPHCGEFSKVFPDCGLDNKLEAAISAAKLSGATIVLKGSDTIIANPYGRAIINNDAPQCLATAGSGDVLAGMIGGLLSTGVLPLQAASGGVWLHSACARQGPCAVAEDLIEQIDNILQGLRNSQERGLYFSG